MLASGAAVEYDWLVLALGSDSVFFGIPGVKEHCLPFCSYNDAVRVGSPPITARFCLSRAPSSCFYMLLCHTKLLLPLMPAVLIHCMCIIFYVYFFIDT